jgi:hypothetical protein
MTTLAQLVTTAATTGTATLTAEDGSAGALGLTAAARLLAVYTADTDTYRENARKTPDRPVVAEEAEDGHVVLSVGSLRYLITDDGADLQQLCGVPGCPKEALAPQQPITRVCEDHLSAAYLDLNGEQARAARLNTWQEIATEATREAAGNQRLLDSLRAAS